MTAKRLLAAVVGGVLALSAVAGAAYAAASAFTDVGDDHEHAAEIAAAHQIGVFNGYGRHVPARRQTHPAPGRERDLAHPVVARH